MHARCTRIFFPEQKSNLVAVLACLTKSSFVTEKKMCKVHMRVFEIVAHRNVDNWTQIIDMVYLGVGIYPFINCR